MVSKFMNFPGPKKGKGRMVIKRPASLKTQSWKQVPYVRGIRAVPARGVRREQAHWRRVVPELLKASDIDIVKMSDPWQDFARLVRQALPQVQPWHFVYVANPLQRGQAEIPM